MARPRTSIDWKIVSENLRADCSTVGIASIFGIGADTLYTRCVEDNGIPWTEYAQKERASGEDLLRMVQYQQALGGSVPLLIWLGKQRLNQSEKQKTELQVSPVECENIDIVIERMGGVKAAREILAGAIGNW